jgi:hypothetical protein
VPVPCFNAEQQQQQRQRQATQVTSCIPIERGKRKGEFFIRPVIATPILYWGGRVPSERGFFAPLLYSQALLIDIEVVLA